MPPSKPSIKPGITQHELFGHWTGKTPECPYCSHINHVTRKEIKKKGKIARLLFSCGNCGAKNSFSNKNLIEKEVNHAS